MAPIDPRSPLDISPAEVGAAAAVHTHPYVATSAVGAASGVASLDSGGKIPQAQLPAIALTEHLGVVASQTAMLALTGQRGDWCTRSDRGTDWQLVAEPSSTLSSWREMLYPASPVSSVNGRTGAVTGLAEADKPIFRAVPAGTQNIATGTRVSILFPTEVVDTANGHSTSSSTDRYVAAVAGWYRVSGVVAFAANGTGGRLVEIQKNNSNANTNLTNVIPGSSQWIAAFSGGATRLATPTVLLPLNVGDYVTLVGFHTAGVTLATEAGQCALDVEYVRPL